MLRKFEVGGVYSMHNIPFKVTHIKSYAGPFGWSGGSMLWGRGGICRQIEIVDIIGDETDGRELAIREAVKDWHHSPHATSTASIRFFKAAIHCAKPTCVIVKTCRSGCVASTRIS